MKITHVKIQPVNGMPRLKGIASIILDDELAINEIKIIQAENGMCVEFPNNNKNNKNNKNKNKFGYQNIAPLNPQIRGYLQSVILDAYQSALEAC